jgi:ketosteroid isomerase-like protein
MGPCETYRRRPPRTKYDEELLDAETFHGHDGVRRYFQSMREAFGDFGWEPQEFLDQGDHVLVETRFFAAGRGSGAPVEAMVYNVWTVGRGRPSEYAAF